MKAFRQKNNSRQARIASEGPLERALNDRVNRQRRRGQARGELIVAALRDGRITHADLDAVREERRERARRAALR